MIAKAKGISDNGKLKFCLFILWGIATFRAYIIGNDTKEYYYAFMMAKNPGYIKASSWRYEYGYLILNVLIRRFTDNYTVFLGIISGFLYFTYYKYIKSRSRDQIFSVILFVCLGFLGQTMNVLRLQIAICICLWADMVRQKANTKRNVIGAVMLIIIACFFQRISLVYLLSLLLPKRIDYKKNIHLFAATLLAIFFIKPLLNLIVKIFPYFGMYLTGGEYIIGEVKSATLLNIFIQIVAVVFCFYTYKLNENYGYDISDNTRETLAYDTNKIYVAMLISIVSTQFNLLDRCADFYWISIIITLPEMIMLYRYQENKNRMILKSMVILLSVIYFALVITLKPDWNRIYPYFTVFTQKNFGWN